MKQGLVWLVALMAIGNSMAQGEPRQADPPLVVNGDLSLTTRDFDAYMQKVPPERRDEFRASAERINPTLDSLWITRVFAQKARAKGLDQDPMLASRMRQAVDAVLADAFVEKVIDPSVKYPDLEPRALEVYKANLKDYVFPEHVSIQHILIGLNGRTRDMAAARAKEVHAEVKSGKEDFLALAKRYSDDPGLAKNGGDILGMATTSFEKPIPAALEALKNVGDVSEPIETRYGFHIVRLTERRPERVRAFDEVKGSLIAAEKEKILSAARLAAINEVRGDPGTHLYLENVQALKSEIKAPDAETLSNLKPRQR